MQGQMICKTCKDKCHSGHKVKYVGVKNGICDCFDKVTICKANDQVRTNYQVGPFQMTTQDKCSRSNDPLFRKVAFKQEAWRCTTCNHTQMICKTCKDTCHKGHITLNAGLANDFCHCFDAAGCKKKPVMRIRTKPWAERECLSLKLVMRETYSGKLLRLERLNYTATHIWLNEIRPIYYLII